VTGTITLTSGHLSIAQSTLTISGPGANVLAISGNNNSRIFFTQQGVRLSVSGLTIENGLTSLATEPNFTGAAPGWGGAISTNGPLTMIRCAVINSTAVSNGYHFGIGLGGGILAGGDLTLTETTVSGNTVICPDSTASAVNGGGAALGGGIVAAQRNHSPITVTLTNCTVTNNTLRGGDNYTDGDYPGAAFGAGIYAYSGTTVTVKNSTVAGNTSVAGQQHANGPRGRAGGGGIAIESGSATLTNTIVAKNTADPAAGPDVNGRFTGSFNLIGDGTGETGLTNGVDGNQVGTSASPIDPLLAALADNDGPTQTMALLPGSRAIDRGNASGVTTDQRGRPRRIDIPSVTNANGGDGSDIGAFEFAPPAQLLNISTRMKVLGGDNVLIGGFIVTGTDQKKVLLRAIGSSLAISGHLADPMLELHDGSGKVIATNDNWKIADATGQSQQSQIQATQVPPSNDLESALIATLPANNSAYTAIVRGKNNGVGVGLVEAYDLSQPASSQLANISTRGLIDTGDNVMIGGLIAGPSSSGSMKVLLRAIGPSLPLSGALADPTLELHNANGTTIATNDNWKIDDATGQSQEAAIRATGAPPGNNAESALLQTVPAGNYTAIVRGKNNTTGIGLVEAYHLP
jgi:hypothetical protein